VAVRGQRALQESQENLDLVDQMDPLALQDPLGHQARKENPDLKDLKESSVNPDPKDPKEVQDPMELQVKLVMLVQPVLQVQLARLVPLAMPPTLPVSLNIPTSTTWDRKLSTQI